MKKIKNVVLSLCMALICLISFVGCDFDNVDDSSSSDSNSGTRYTAAETYVNSLLENFDYNVDYTYTDPYLGEDKTVYHTYKNGIEYIYGYREYSTEGDDVTGYYTTTYSYEDNYIIENKYNENSQTYTTTGYIGTSSYAYMIAKSNMWTTDGVLILFAKYESITLQQDETAVISNMKTSIMETKTGVTTITKTCDYYSELEKSCSVKIVIDIENGLVTSCTFLMYDTSSGVIDSSTTVEYTYTTVNINTDFSNYNQIS